jgi:hypothetical protein
LRPIVGARTEAVRQGLTLQQLLLALAGAVVAGRIALGLEDARGLREKLGSPLVDLARVHAVAARQVGYRLLLLHGFKRHFGLERGIVSVAALLRHRCCSLLVSEIQTLP